jgi:hypothetical protein
MKKSLLALALSVAFITAANAQVIITEIMYNPPESGTDSLEYFEIYNNSGAAVDISGWNFTQGIEHVFPAGTVMAAGSYIVLAKSANAFQLVFGFTPTVWTNGALTNSPGEDIELSDANGTVIDVVNYLNAAPWPVEAAGAGSALVLCNYDGDNNVAANWIAATTGTGVSVNGIEVKGNPNAASGCQVSGDVVANPDEVFAASGQAKTFNVLSNDLFVGANPIVLITTSPTQGSATVVGSTIVYQSVVGYCGPDQFEYTVNNGSSSDVAAVSVDVRCYPLNSIGSVTGVDADGVATSLNEVCELRGVVYGTNIRPLTGTAPSLLFTIIDEQGNGIAVSSLNGTYGYTVQEKDNISVRGTIGQFNGITEIRPDTIIKNSSNNTLLAPTVVITHSEATESQLIKINNLHLVDAAEWTTGVGGSGFNVRAVADANPNDTILIRIDRDVETYNAPVPPQPFNLTGIGGQFDSSSPFTSGYQVLPRYNADISSLVGAKEADFSASVNLSPNPTADILVIDMTSAFDRVTILSASGRKIKTLEAPDRLHKVDVSLLPAGAYFVRFEQNGSVWTTRFVKI